MFICEDRAKNLGKTLRMTRESLSAACKAVKALFKSHEKTPSSEQAELGANS